MTLKLRSHTSLCELVALLATVAACSTAETTSDLNPISTTPTPAAAAKRETATPITIPVKTLPGLTLSVLEPTWGPITGGTILTLGGTGFSGTLKVEIGNKECKSPQILSDSKITCTTTEGSVGRFAVKISKENDVAILPEAFIYSTTPTVAAVNPASGYLTGSTAVTILGENFAPGLTIKFGDFFCSDLNLISSSVIQCKTPAVSGAGAVDVKAKNVDGIEAKLAAGFQFLTPPTAPTNTGGGSFETVVSAVVPAEGPLAGGTSLNIVGNNFSVAATVTIGGQACTNPTADS